jgi:hypothetical protein
MSKKWRVAAIVGVLVIAVSIIVALYIPGNGQQYERDVATSTATTTDEQTESGQWQIYIDTQYQFSIDYPKNWKIAKDDLAGSPRITLYDPHQTGGVTAPFTHHDNTAVHVSIFPKGLPTEGVSGEMMDTHVQSREQLARSTDFILKDKTPWATMLTFQKPPTSWSGGFVWANATVQNLDITCLRGEQFVPYEQCDVLTGDVYVREGSVEPSIRATEVRMLESFHFTR